MSVHLGVIADDFTGATDIAGLLARSGVAVRLRIGVPAGPPRDAAAFEVIALKIRTVPVTDAVAQARAAADWLRRAGAGRLYWKYCSTFDSTAEGNIGPVAEALMDVVGADQAIYCPAFPENGRSVFMGHLFVGRQPLDESPMKDHPLTPMRDANLMRLLAPQVTKAVGLVDRLTVAKGAPAVRAELARLRAEGVAHVICDAVADSDLSVLADACRDAALMTGGSALAAPLPGLLSASLAMTGAAPSRRIAPGAVVLSGSCSAMTRAQVAAYAGHAPSFRLNPLTLASDGPGAALDWLAAQDPATAPLIYATADPDAVRAAQEGLGRDRAGAVVEDALAQIAIAARDRGIARIVVAGGETSGAVTQALGVTDLDVGREIAPGVPWCFAQSEGLPLALALKSGNFGSVTFFSDALAALEPA